MHTVDSDTDTEARRTLADEERAEFTHALFGLHFPLRLEPTVFAIADRLSRDYSGGLWHFHSLNNGGFYMAPASDAIFNVACENGFEGVMTADALGITVCLYAYSHLSFGGGDFADACAQHYHLLRDFAMDHREVRAILAAID